MGNKASLYRMDTPKHLCPYGLKSLHLLKKRGFDVSDHLLKSAEETEAFKQQHQVKTTPQTFIDGVRIGGYDDLKAYFGVAKNKDEPTYVPVITIYGMACLMALAIGWVYLSPFTLFSFVQMFVALAMCMLAVQKLRDLSAFSLRFITYDLIAMSYVPYAYIYAFVEALGGLGMLANAPIWLICPPILFIGVVGIISIVKAVYIESRELKCACVGGSGEVPLGMVSLLENSLMVGVAVWMLVR